MGAEQHADTVQLHALRFVSFHSLKVKFPTLVGVLKNCAANREKDIQLISC